MMHNWQKLGLLYCPGQENRHPHLLSHAANPLPVLIKDNVYRIYYSGRDINNRSSVGAVDIDIVLRKVICEHYEPFFSFGSPNSYYSHGVSIGNCYESNGITYMLFMGWQIPPGMHWRGDIGRLRVGPKMELFLDSPAPFIGEDAIDPISLSYPWVERNQKQNRYDMWYGSTLTWDAGNGEMLHTLHFATSQDGHSWQKEGLSIPYTLGLAQAFSRPTVLRNNDKYRMWFSYRGLPGKSYRIGHAISDDGLKWKLALESSGIDVSEQGWDSEMIEYPFVFNHQNKTYMLYNGNGYGKTGFGLALLQD